MLFTENRSFHSANSLRRQINRADLASSNYFNERPKKLNERVKELFTQFSIVDFILTFVEYYSSFKKY